MWLSRCKRLIILHAELCLQSKHLMSEQVPLSCSVQNALPPQAAATRLPCSRLAENQPQPVDSAIVRGINTSNVLLSCICEHVFHQANHFLQILWPFCSTVYGEASTLCDCGSVTVRATSVYTELCFVFVFLPLQATLQVNTILPSTFEQTANTTSLRQEECCGAGGDSQVQVGGMFWDQSTEHLFSRSGNTQHYR